MTDRNTEVCEFCKWAGDFAGITTDNNPTELVFCHAEPTSYAKNRTAVRINDWCRHWRPKTTD